MKKPLLRACIAFAGAVLYGPVAGFAAMMLVLQLSGGEDGTGENAGGLAFIWLVSMVVLGTIAAMLAYDWMHRKPRQMAIAAAVAPVAMALAWMLFFASLDSV